MLAVKAPPRLLLTVREMADKPFATVRPLSARDRGCGGEGSSVSTSSQALDRSVKRAPRLTGSARQGHDLPTSAAARLISDDAAAEPILKLGQA